MRHGILAAIAIGAIAMPCVFGYNGETYPLSGQATQITQPGASSLQFYLNSGVVAGATSTIGVPTVITGNSNPTGAVESAMASWNNVANTSVHFNALQSTTAGEDPNDCQYVISIASSTADVSIVGGATGVIGLTINAFTEGLSSACGGTIFQGAQIVDSDILLNPYYQFSTTGATGTVDLQAVVTHEFGHVLGLNHSSLVGATMYPYSERIQRHLSSDEKAFAAQYYPSGQPTLGTISGTATLGGNPIQYGLITATDLSGGGKIACGLTAVDGTFSVQVPPGLYNVYVEPFNSFIHPTNIYSLTNTTTGELDPTQVTTGFQATFAGGNTVSSTTPTQYTVTAGSTSTANITAIAGATTLTATAYGIGAAGGKGDITSLSALNGPISVTAGTSFDLALSGTGLDSTVTFYYVGTNVTVATSAPRADTVNGTAVVRQTLTIGSQTNTTLGSLWIVKGSNYLSLSGILDIEPLKPVISNVEDAESARTSVTSGQWAVVYGSNLAHSERTWNANTDFTGGVSAGSPLPTSLDGVSVTVAGVPAGVYFVCNTCSPNQVNFVTPSGLTPGNATVVVSNQGSASSTFTTTVVQASPSFFYYPAGSNIYPAAVHLSDGNIVGDPTVLASTERAHPGETIAMFCNGLAAATGGIIVPVTAFTQQVTVTAGTTPLTVSAPYLVAAGEFQINVTIPSTLAAGNYQLTMTVPGGTTAGDGVTITLPVGQ